eukprot:NODE_433_length_8727_cov_0.399397.p1 type:complete len:913 gc:universal NODE_433_length_8727_cov_0.399397:5586-8324(+)
MKISGLYLLVSLVFSTSIDCPDVINLATGLNMGQSSPALFKALKADCCSSFGVYCYNDRVANVYWPNLHLTGSINSTALPKMLFSLDLTGNRITGNFPKTLPPSLLNLYLSNNFITGDLSSVTVSDLEKIDVRSNKLNGSIPLLPSTYYFYASYNMLSGCIPTLSSSIRDFVATNNLLNCSIPAPLPEFLWQLDLTSNKLSGPIPSLPALIYIVSLGFNQISGEVPVLPPLYHLDLQSSDVNGTIHLIQPGFVSITNTSISSVTIDNSGSLLYCDMRDTNLANVANDPQLPRCDRSISSPSTMPDCNDVINLAYGLNMHISSPDLMRQLEFNCCLAKQLITCDATNVIEIDFNSLNLDGAINGTAIPPLIRKLYLDSNFISGSIPENLPITITRLKLSSNFLSGQIPNLPADLTLLTVNSNWLNGSIPTTLPSKLNTLDISYNYFTGMLPINLPSSLIFIYANNNYLNGSLPAFSDNLYDLVLSMNKFTGSLLLKKPVTLDINHNYISNVTIKDISQVYKCDISDNPLLSHISDPNLASCQKKNLYVLDCADVIELAIALHLDLVQPALMSSISRNCCSNAGVTCTAGQVNKIKWPNMGLNGTMDSKCMPKYLTSLDLSLNEITGSVPNSMPSSLTNLTLHSNKLSDALPSDLPLSLEYLDVSDNKIDGSIPSALPTGLQWLLVNRNNLSGTLPDTIPPGLIYLDVSSNNLSGLVPNLTSIERVYLNGDFPPFNQFSGNITILKPRELYVPNNIITNIFISDIQQMTICNIANNPFLVNINDTSLSSCVKYVLSRRISSLSRTLDSTPVMSGSLLKTRSRQQSATQYSEMGSIDTHSSTATIEYSIYDIGRYSINIHWTSFIIGRCIVSIMVFIAVLYYSPFRRSIIGWRQTKFNSSKNTKNDIDKALRYLS